MRPQIEIGHLKYFYFVVLEGGVTPAANRLCVQQPVVSKMVKSLEGQLGKALFKKDGRRNVLTDFGQLVYRHCQAIFAELEKVERLELKPNEVTGTFGIGAVEPVASHLLGAKLLKLSEAFPLVNLSIYTSTATQLLQMISTGKLDVGIFFHAPALPDNLEIIHRTPTRFRVVVQTAKKNSKETIQFFIGSREVDDLSNHKFPTIEMMRKKYPDTRIRMSSNHLGLHREMVLRGKGASVLPEFMIAADLKRGSLVDLYPKEKLHFDMKYIAKRGSTNDQLVAFLLGI